MVTLSVEHNGRYLICRANGTNSVESVLEYMNGVHDAMERFACGKVLILENLEGPGLNLLEMYSILQNARKTILSKPHAIAYIDENPLHDHRSLKFAETVALNRFIYIKFFSQIDEASAWLDKVSA